MVRLSASVLGIAAPFLLALSHGSEQAGHGRVAYESIHVAGGAALGGSQPVVSVIVVGSEHCYHSIALHGDAV